MAWFVAASSRSASAGGFGAASCGMGGSGFGQMCNLYCITTNQAAIAAPFRVMNQVGGTGAYLVRCIGGGWDEAFARAGAKETWKKSGRVVAFTKSRDATLSWQVA